MLFVGQSFYHLAGSEDGISLHQDHRRCIILMDHNDSNENVSMAKFYLMSKLQAAIAEQCVPILVHASLWNSFLERRITFAQALSRENTKEHFVFSTYQNINDRIAYWWNHFRELSDDMVHNKELVVHRINQEFYETSEKIWVTCDEYQMLLNYETAFDPEQWSIYKKEGVFLLIPKKYIAALQASYSVGINQDLISGFKLSSLEMVENPEEVGAIYFDSYPEASTSIVQNLPAIFLGTSDFPDGKMPYVWDIALSGHGGWQWYDQEIINEGKIEYDGKPIIADLTVEQFSSLLHFFDTEVKTNFLHYSTCYGGGNHTILPFQEQPERRYSYTIACATLTDCASYCKWGNNLPGYNKRFLTPHDLQYNTSRQQWELPLEFSYKWDEFFYGIGQTDFQKGFLDDSLPALFCTITDPTFEDTCLLRLPGSAHFYPVYPESYAKITDRMMALADEYKVPVCLHSPQIILLESEVIAPELWIENSNQMLRIISIKPAKASHYFKKIVANQFLDIPSIFWQGCGQVYDKVFIIDELRFPRNADSLMFENIQTGSELVLKNVVVIASKDQLVRIFFSIEDVALMAVAHRSNSFSSGTIATVQEVVQLSARERQKYEEKYATLVTETLEQQRHMREEEVFGVD
jgi:hypothetical protein